MVERIRWHLGVVSVAALAIVSSNASLPGASAPHVNAAASICGTNGVYTTAGFGSPFQLHGTCTYTTVGEDTFQVPASVSVADVTLDGGNGGSPGAEVRNTTLPIPAGATLYVDVGGNGTQDTSGTAWFPGLSCVNSQHGLGGYPDGGNGGVSCFSSSGWGGGGSSSLSLAPRGSVPLTGDPATDPRLMVAAGGGSPGTFGSATGGWGGTPGKVGPGVGGGGSDAPCTGAQRPTTDGGVLGSAGGAPGPCGNATAGSLTKGGDGADGGSGIFSDFTGSGFVQVTRPTSWAGGGGGGGWFGGGGGSSSATAAFTSLSGGGGGGSSYGGAGAPINVFVSQNVDAVGHPAAPPRVVITFAFPCVPVSRNGIVAWWSGNDTNLDVAVGNLPLSQTFVHPILYTPGHSGSAFGFNPDYGGLSDRGVAPVSTGLSIEGWVKPTRSDEVVQTLVARWSRIGLTGANDTSHSYNLSLYPNDQIVFEVDDTTTRVPEELRTKDTALFDGQFHHVAVTWDRTSMSIYIDGVRVATKASQGGTLNGADAESVDLGYGPFTYNGAIDEPTIWSRALSASEIALIAGGLTKC
jgi:hypothetical protein